MICRDCTGPFLHANGRCRRCYTVDLYARNPAAKQQRLSKARESDRVAYAKMPKEDRYWRNRKARLARYGLTIDTFEAMRTGQSNRCAICLREPPEGQKLCIDHNHKTKAVRGLLCRRCNYGLTWFADRSEHFDRAAVYLRRNKC